MTTTALNPPQRLETGGASSPRTAFVLSGGAGLGALQVGMLEALYERAITPDFLVGTSAADGGDAEATLAQFESAGVDVDALAATLQSEGARNFVKSWDDLLTRIDNQVAAVA